MILVLDIGSSSARASLWDMEAQPILGATARVQYRFDAHGTINPAFLRSHVETCIDTVLSENRDVQITAVGCATFVSNIMGTDADGKPTTRLLTYADARSATHAERLTDEVDMVAVHARTGCRVHPAYHPPKLAWLAAEHPDVFAATARWTDIATWLYATWIGAPVPCSLSVASWGGLLDQQADQWDADWLARLKMGISQLPALADYNEAVQGLSAAYAARWPQLSDVPFFLAVGDGAAANIGARPQVDDGPVLTVGTTAAVRVIQRERQPVHEGLWRYRVDRGRYLVGGATSEGGNVLAWGRDTLAVDLADVGVAIRSGVPGDHRLAAVPLIAGERSPGYRADASGFIHGLRLSTTATDITRALMEGVAIRLRLIYDLMGRPGDAITANGGAITGTPAFAGLLADVLAVQVAVSDVGETTSRGVARLALAALGEAVPEADDAPMIYEPRAGVRDAVDDLIERHTRLYDRLWE
jgi:gluconokinase